MTGFEWAYENPILNGTLSLLTRHRFSPRSVSLDVLSNDFVRAGWLATYLSASSEHGHRKKALLFAALAKQTFPDDASIETLCYSIFARTQTLPAAMHLENVAGDRREYVGPPLGPLSAEFCVAFNRSWSDIAGGLVLTGFQRQLEDALSGERAGVISAPTSAGKSFIVHEHVKRALRERRFVGLFIVPTKALIAQICAIYRRFKTRERIDVQIRSSVTDGMDTPASSLVLALTQERCVRLLNTPLAKDIDFVFVDEIQALEQPDRGTLLEYVVNQLTDRAPTATFFAAGPFLANSAQLGRNLFRRECQPLETEDSPVSQIVVRVSPVKMEKLLDLRIVAGDNRSRDTSLQLAVDKACYSRWQGNHGVAISDSIHLFALKSPCLVYAHGPGWATNWASHYASTVDVAPSLSREADDLLAYIAESIHPQCSLIKCIQKRVAYHHSALPDFVREEIESLFSEREIDILFCTSTLLEGVNLPAEKLFILSPKKDDDVLTDFEFRNLIGRAGRLDEHLCGLVYCIQVPEEEKSDWIEQYRDAKRKDVQPAVDSKIGIHFDALVEALEGGVPVSAIPKELRPTVAILRTRFLRDSKEMSFYLARKNLSPLQISKIANATERGLVGMSMPADVALRSPSVDPILQSMLFQRVKENPKEWIIRRDRGRSKDIETVFKLLDEIFGIIEEVAPFGERIVLSPQVRGIFREELLRIARLWLEGKPFREIVVRSLPAKRRYATDITEDEADDAIMKAMKIITKGVTFVIAKYFAVLAEVLKAVVPETERTEFSFVLAMPVMLELGCSDGKTLALVTACLPRAVALRVAPMIPDGIEDPVAWLSENEQNSRLQRLPLIYHKVLRRCGIWPDSRESSIKDC